ncbi:MULTISPECIES: EscU/YscU/HrcU family type III secretion system export apparatus switch protein [Sulfurospirillum]|uniref:FlhB domain protein n=2 Tax=Sulfurospirillum multivorans TaxID=66821 RepID=A0AA86AIQ9_SULMK|nr:MULTISPECIES: EscU/YscU/HrcU family type III secretion system export apparatus switch protein [Sulfurospirillum]AHJ11405.1 FlhB domain protein [Sulfurospirillum multivorans DSM 12446]KFL33253.1 type III secretion exporter [Sulfurospirillum sp. SCADC]QEH04909.1 FlhB domain protein [Sulfurospirillum multivorans]
MNTPSPKPQKAVALKYDREKKGAPRVVASGKGEVANNIIKLAQEHDIFIKKDADLVELLSKIELNKEIPPMLYKAVAEVFSFIYKITGDKRK